MGLSKPLHPNLPIHSEKNYNLHAFMNAAVKN